MIIGNGFIANSLRDNPNCVVYAGGATVGSDTEIIDKNINSTLEAVKNIPKGKRLIYISSSRVGDGTVYGQTKLLAEKLLTHRPLSLIRSTNVFGESCKPFRNSVVATFCHQIANNKPPTIKEPDKEILLVYIDDLVRVIEEEMRNDKNYSFRFVSGEAITVGELAYVLLGFSQGKEPQNDLQTNLKKVYDIHVRTVHAG